MDTTRAPHEGEPAAPRRALFRGTLGIGLVSIPVSLHRAVARRTVRFHELHDADGGRIRRRAVCDIDGAGVPLEHIVKGFEVERGRWVTLSADELRAIVPAEPRAIEIVELVDAGEIDPIYYERTYWIVPDEGAEPAYALLQAAMERTRRAAIARFTARARRHLAAVHPSAPAPGAPRALALTTLAFPDEIIAPGVAAPADRPAPSERDLALAERLVDSLSGAFRPERYHDEQREQILAYLRSKAAVAAPALPPEPQPPPAPIDLRGALEASVAEAERRRSAA
jgi:DNA end-binding protein Ku